MPLERAKDSSTDFCKLASKLLTLQVTGEDGGRLLFRTDPYGWDDKLAEALGLGKQLRRRVREKIEDIGP